MPTGPSRGLIRAALVEGARGALPPDEPEVLRAVSGLSWRLERRLRTRRAARWEAAAREVFGVSARTAEALVREAHDVDLQRRLEEVLLPRVEATWLPRYVELVGLEVGAPPGVLLSLGAPHPFLALAAFAQQRPGLVAVAAPVPEERGRGDRQLRARFEEERLRLPVRWVSWGDLPTALAEGHDVQVTADPVHQPRAASLPAILARLTANGQALSALLAQGPVRVLTTHRERDKSWRAILSPALDQPAAILEAFAAHITEAPGQYLPWLEGSFDAPEAPH